MAVEYAKKQIEDPVKKAELEKRTAKGQHAFNLAVSEFMKISKNSGESKEDV